MAMQRGRDMVLKLGDGATPENFIVVAGLRAKSIILRADPVESRSIEGNAAWRQLVSGVAPKSAMISGFGVFCDGAAASLVRGVFFSQEAKVWRLLIPGLGQLAGRFVIEQLEYSAEHAAELRFSIRLSSDGEMAFTSV